MTKSHHSIRRNIWAGLAVSVLLVGSVAGWAATTDIAGAIIAPGALVVDSNVRKVQHPTGGVIGEIRARDGDRVKAGDIVVRLDATTTRANLAIVSKGLDELLARKARLEAERDDREGVAFAKDLLARIADADAAHIMTGERKLFELRRAARSGQKSQLRQRIIQLEQEAQGQAAQAAVKVDELGLIQTELKGALELWDKKLYPITKLTELKREAARLDGERAQLLSSIAQVRGKIAETELQIVQVDRDLGSDVAKELRDGDAKIGEFLERKVAADDQLQRIDIRAPISGVIYQSTVFTVGGVITANGEPLMLIVPEAEKLSIEAKVSPQDIDQLRLGQPALLRFSAFNQRTTPEINGVLTRIAADVTTEQRTGASYYTVRIAVAPDEIARLGDVKLVPGMPVETFIQTGERKVLSYLTKPLADQIARAFRER